MDPTRDLVDRVLRGELGTFAVAVAVDTPVATSPERDRVRLVETMRPMYKLGLVYVRLDGLSLVLLLSNEEPRATLSAINKTHATRALDDRKIVRYR